ncbi:uncharacterized protein LOC116416200 [Nasonia vitripennis]|uniref:Uncharacterized protein n=1 Tax=Nasonia vitripennis TaxID=7425 RepID=A0A7M7T7B5_NASVI|nr:uncharacterized protein LOC116416200 [Nasonia vitripennis]
MSHLKLECGDAYPPKEMKTKVAKSIIISFPKLKSTTGCGYEHFYNEKLSSSFLEWRLKTMRKTLKSSEKKRTRGKKRSLTDSSNVQVELSLEEYESKVSELQFKMPNDTNKFSILQLMDETRSNRQQWIKDPENHVTLHDILNKFPRFTDFKGELILREFQYQITDKDTFLGRFPSYYGPWILKYCKVTKPQLLDQVRYIADSNIKALLILPNVLPSPNYMRRKTNDSTKIKGQKK